MPGRTGAYSNEDGCVCVGGGSTPVAETRERVHWGKRGTCEVHVWFVVRLLESRTRRGDRSSIRTREAYRAE